MNITTRAVMVLLLCPLFSSSAQNPAKSINDSNTALHLLQAGYQTPYRVSKPEEIKSVLDRMLVYLDVQTPARLVKGSAREPISDLSKPVEGAALEGGDFRLISYEWGVTYAAMLAAGEATGDKRYTAYTFDRFRFIAKAVAPYREAMKSNPSVRSPFGSVLTPHALDDAGAMCAAMIKASRMGIDADLRPMIDNYTQYILTKEFRLADGTLARNRPQKNTLWLDDMFMGIPAIAQLGALTGEKRYYDEAVKQIELFSKRMFVKEKGLYLHGWVESSSQHPAFHWGRANGWAILTLVEVLDVLPETHPGYPVVLAQLRDHIKGLASYQSGEGFWHQLLDRPDSYLETSATAIFTYCIARAVNKGWIDAIAYGPVAQLGWHAVSTQVNEKGQVEGTCVGTGMAFDPAYYYYRPINVMAAHGYGPVIFAGAEMIRLLKNQHPRMNDSAVQFYDKEIPGNAPIFSVE